MKKLILISILAVFVLSCTTKKHGTMEVTGAIKGLKKGTLYLQKIKDTLLVTVDSIKLNGDNHFTLSDDVKSPEIYYLTLKEVPSKKIQFFGEKGDITINTRLDRFITDAKIKGLKNQDLLDKYERMSSKFNNKKLDLVKADFDAQKAHDTPKIDSIDKVMKNLIIRKYLYTTNFAVRNANYSVSPYLALTQLYNANIKLLDTINNSLSKKVKNSKYGKKLNKFISKIKATEKNN